MRPDFAVTTPMRDAATLSRPRFRLPAGSCDAHFHVFEPGYAHIAKPLYTFPEATLQQYLRASEALGLERMVLVQPTYYGTDNRLTLDVLAQVGQDRCRAVVQVAEDVPEAELDRFHALGVRAIRLDLFARREEPTEALAAYVRRMAARARPRGWHLQFYAPGAVVRDLLPHLAELEDPFVIDHLGYMLEAEGLTQADVDQLLELLRQGSCWIKLSGAYRIAKDRPLSAVAPLGRALVEARADRLIWGSDWPHLPDGQRDTGELVDLLADWAPETRDRQRILVEGPDALFFGG